MRRLIVRKRPRSRQPGPALGPVPFNSELALGPVPFIPNQSEQILAEPEAYLAEPVAAFEFEGSGPSARSN